MRRFLPARILLGLLLPVAIAHADAPVIWSGTTVKWLPSGLHSAGIPKLDANGVETVYTTDGLVKMSSGVPGAATSGTDYAPATSGSALLKGNGAGGFSSAVSDTDYQAPISVSAFGSTPNADGISFSTDTLTLQPADGTNPGGVSTGSQTFAGTKTFSNIIDSGLTASYAVVTNGSKQLSSLQYTYANTGSALVQRDSNGNVYGNNNISTTATIVSAGGTTTLSGGSARYEKVTGTSAQTIKMPDATTLVTGWIFEINNNSTQAITIQNNSAGAITTMPSGSYAYIINTDNSTIAGAWDVHWGMPSNASYGTAGATIAGALNVTGTTTLDTGISGLLKATSGVVSAAVSGTDFAPATSGTAIQKGNGSGGFSAAVAGTDYQVPITAGDVTASGSTATIGAGKVTNAMLAGSIDLATKVTGALAIVNGGTGQTTATAAFDALAPCSTQGDIAYYNGTHWVCLGTGTAGYVLKTGGAAANPAWVDVNTLVTSHSAQVYTGSNLTPGANGVIKWDGIISDPDSAYSATTGLYTAPVDGNYLVTATLQTTSGITGVYVSTSGGTSVYGGNANTSAAPSSAVVHMTAGQTVGIYFDTGTRTISANAGAAPYLANASFSLIR